MKPVFFSIVAMICYSLANVLVEQKLSRLNALTIINCYSSVIFIVTFLAWLIVSNNDDPAFQFPPTGKLLWFALGVGLMFTLADYFFITAYTSGGKLFVVTSIYVLFPVVASFMKYLLSGEIPNRWQVCEYVLGILAVLCITKGSCINENSPVPP